MSISLLPCALQHLLHIRFISRCILLMFIQGSKRWYMHLSYTVWDVKFRLNEIENAIDSFTKSTNLFDIMWDFIRNIDNLKIILKYFSKMYIKYQFSFIEKDFLNSWLCAAFNALFLNSNNLRHTIVALAFESDFLMIDDDHHLTRWYSLQK